MTSTFENQKHVSMDASRTVHLTMTEIKEITYQLNRTIETMEVESPENESVDSGIHNEKKVMLKQIIDKLQGNDNT